MRYNLGGVIVHENTGAAGCHDNWPEDLQWTGDAGIQISEAYQVVPNDPAAGVEDQNDQCFFALVEPVRNGDVLSPVLHGAFWGIDHLSRKRAFPDPQDLEFMGCS